MSLPGTPGSERSPSSDTAAHAYVYRHMPEVGGVVHTHSTYAVAWAARGEEIPCVITAMADEFGGPIPIGPFAIIGDDSIGRGIVETLRGHRSPGVLMQNHGPFTIGVDGEGCGEGGRDAGGRRPHGALSPGRRVQLIPIPQEAIDRLYDRYQNVYGQAGEDRRGGSGMNPDAAAEAIRAGRAALGIELGSTRIKACLIGTTMRLRCSPRVATRGRTEFARPALDLLARAVWSGLQAAYADLVADVDGRYGARLEQVARDRRLGDDARLPRVRRGRASCSSRSAPGGTRTPGPAAEP